MLPLCLILATFAVIVRRASQPLDNFDTYFHLRFGEEFLHGWSLRHPGSVSTLATNDWVPTQWLSQMVMALFDERFGLAGVAWLNGLQQLALAGVLYLAVRRWADPIAAAPIVIVALIACGPGLSMRPQVLSYIMVVLVTDAWLRTLSDGRVRWWLIPLAWVWAMLHGMWPIGIVIGAAAVTGMALDRSAQGKRLLAQAAIPLGAAVAGALTPVGPALYPAVALVNSRRDYFSEWAPTRFTAPNAIALLLMLMVILVVALRSGSRWDWGKLCLLLTVGAWSVYSSRTVELAACMAAPLAAQALQTQLPALRSRVPRAELITVLGGLTASLILLGTVAAYTANKPPPQPAWADPVLGDLPSGTRVLDDWAVGGYLMWRYPQLDLVMHGYGDTFTDAELARNKAIGDLKPGWDNLVRATGAQYAVLAPDSRVTYALTHFLGWTVIRSSPDVELLRAPSPSLN